MKPCHSRAVSDHFDGLRFFNPGQPSTDRSLADVLRWQMRGRRAAWPAEVAVVAARPRAREAGLVVTMVGHASVLVQAGGVNVLVDPVWSERASPVRFAGPRRVTAPGVAFGDLPPIDAVLITHNHYDHLDVATLARLAAAHRPLVVAALGNEGVIAAAMPGCRVVTADWGGRVDAAGMPVVLHPANHWSARGVRDRRTALWCGFVLLPAGGPVYLAGDTGYGDGAVFRAVRAGFGPPRLAVLPIGAYEPRWFMRDQHVDPAEAVRIMADCGAKAALGVHWGTFQLTDEARLAPVEALTAACAAAGAGPGRFRAFAPGEVWRG